MNGDVEARRQRAAQLRKRIAEVTGHSGGDPDDGRDRPAAADQGYLRSPPRVGPVSPRTFVEERMRDLARGKEKDKKD